VFLGAHCLVCRRSTRVKVAPRRREEEEEEEEGGEEEGML